MQNEKVYLRRFIKGGLKGRLVFIAIIFNIPIFGQGKATRKHRFGKVGEGVFFK